MWAAGILHSKTFPGILAARNRSAAGPTAPARGLFLHSVEYARKKLRSSETEFHFASSNHHLTCKHPCYSESIPMPLLSPTSAFSRVTALAAQRPVHAAFAWLHGNPKTIMDWQIELVAIPAPPYGEQARAQWLAAVH